MLWQDAGDAKERTQLGALQKFIKEQKLEELPILAEANNRMTQLDLQSAERKRAASIAAAAAAAQEASKKRAASAAAAVAHEVSKNILDSNKRRQLPVNVVHGSLGQNTRSVETLSQQVMSKQSIPAAVGVPNQYQAASSYNILAGVTHNPLLPAGNQRPIGIQNQALVAPSVQTQYSGVADFYNLASIRPSGLNVPSASTSSRSKLYSEDPLASMSRASDKKGSSYTYSLSNMSKYNP
jgi:hypothetical protein